MRQEDAEKIHRASLALLDDPGVRIEHDEIYDALMQAGAKPGVGAQVVRFPEGLVMDHEILGYVRRYLRGVEVTEETLAVDLTREVGICGSFLDTDHTLMHFRSEFFEPSILFRKRRPDWVDAGQKTLRDAAEDCADALIAQERVPHLTTEQDAALAEIEADFLERVR